MEQAAETRPPAIVYTRSPDEPLLQAVVAAFSDPAVEVDPRAAEPIYEWVDFDGIDSVIESSQSEVRIATRIWDRQVVITADTVQVYDRSE